MMATKHTPHSVALPLEQPLLAAAWSLAQQAHQQQVRHDGSPYISHPLAVAERCFVLYQDEELASAALLHDVVEDCPGYSILQLEHICGTSVGFMVDAVTKTILSLHEDPSLHFDTYHEKLLWCGLEDIRALLLKLADREHNLATVAALPLRDQVKIFFETLTFYIPLAHMLGTVGRPGIHDIQRHFFHYLLTHGLLTPSAIVEHLHELAGSLYGDMLAELVPDMDFNHFLGYIKFQMSEQELHLLYPVLRQLCAKKSFF